MFPRLGGDSQQSFNLLYRRWARQEGAQSVRVRKTTAKKSEILPPHCEGRHFVHNDSLNKVILSKAKDLVFWGKARHVPATLANMIWSLYATGDLTQRS